MASLLDFIGNHPDEGLIYSIRAQEKYLEDISKISMSSIEIDDCSDFTFHADRVVRNLEEGTTDISYNERLFFFPDTGINAESFNNFISIFDSSGLRVFTNGIFKHITSIRCNDIDFSNKFNAVIIQNKVSTYYNPIWLIISIMRIWVSEPEKVNKIFRDFNNLLYYSKKHQLLPMLAMVYRNSDLQINNIPLKLFFDEDIFDIATSVRSRYSFHDGEIFSSKSFIPIACKDYERFMKVLNVENPTFNQLLSCIQSIQKSHKEEYLNSKWKRHEIGY